MKIFRGRPIIEAGDSPKTIDNALHESLGYWNGQMPDVQAFEWEKEGGRRLGRA